MEVLALFCIFSCSVEPLMQKKYICKCTSFLQSTQTLKHYHFNITFDLYVFKKIGYNLLLRKDVFSNEIMLIDCNLHKTGGNVKPD